MSLLDYVNVLGEWFLSNLDKFVFSAVTLFVVYVIYRVVIREIRSLTARAIINIIISSSIMEFLVTQKFLKKQMLKKISYRKNNKTQQRDSARNRNLTRGS